MTIELDSTLAQAEVLFLSFRQLLEDMERRRAENAAASGEIRRRTAASEQSSSTSASRIVAKPNIPLVSEELRDLLKTGR